jgi:hypothetical protein
MKVYKCDICKTMADRPKNWAHGTVDICNSCACEIEHAVKQVIDKHQASVGLGAIFGTMSEWCMKVQSQAYAKTLVSNR